MAADAYLKVAAGQLQQAATAVKQSADQVKAEAARTKHQLENDITMMQSDIKVRQLEFDRSKDEPAKAATIQTNIQRLQKEMEVKKQQLSQITSQTEQVVRGKERTYQKLASQASGLSQQAGDPNLR